MARKYGRSLHAAIRAAHGTELEAAASAILTRIVIANVTNARIAAALGVSGRHVRRTLALYGWMGDHSGNAQPEMKRKAA